MTASRYGLVPEYKSRLGTCHAAASIRSKIAFLMRRLLVITALLLALQTASQAQEANPDDVSSVDAILTAVYDVISGPAGREIDWERFHSLFLPDTRLIPIVRDSTGATSYISWTPTEFMERTSEALLQDAFYELEIDRSAQHYGNLVHAFSTYESYRSLEEGTEPFARGINSFQLLYKDDRWWIMTIFWQPEWPGLPIPAEYLPAGE